MFIEKTKSILSPIQLRNRISLSTEGMENVRQSRENIHSIIHGKDSRLLVIVGPCSIHDRKAAIEYAGYLQKWREEFGGALEIVMRTYFEKPRTTIGWKGLINDPHLDGSYDIEEGLQIARILLCDIVNMGIPTATEFLDPLSALYLSDLVSWGAIGARTTESQTHRELASGLPCPIGFKNGTDGSVKIAVDAMLSSARSHTFLSGGDSGNVVVATTSGNSNTHIILRGSNKGINYDHDSIMRASEMVKKVGLPHRIMIDVSHQNSQKDYNRQIEGINAIIEELRQGEDAILGVMIESFLIAGAQSYTPGKDNLDRLTYGQSITDGCVDIGATYEILQKLFYTIQQK